MSKKLIITEKPSVARQFASALGVRGNQEGYIENDEWVITWCVGHLVSLCMPEKYDDTLKKWSLTTLPTTKPLDRVYKSVLLPLYIHLKAAQAIADPDI